MKSTNRHHASILVSLLLPACTASSLEPWPSEQEPDQLTWERAPLRAEPGALQGEDTAGARAEALPSGVGEVGPPAMHEAWSRAFGRVPIDLDDEIRAVATDAVENVYVAGTFRGGITLGGDPFANVSGGRDLFVVKLSPTGDLQWYAVLLGEGDATLGDMRVNGAGDVVIGGGFDGTLRLGADEVSAFDGTDAFVLGIDGETGDPRWVRVDEREGDQAITALAVSKSGNIAIGVEQRSETGFHALVSLLDRHGNELWTAETTGEGQSIVEDIEIDEADNLYLAGSFTGEVAFGGPALTSAGSWDAAIIALDESGKHVWSESYGDGAPDFMSDLALSRDGLVAVGDYRGTLTLAGQALTSTDESRDVFVMALDRNGEHRMFRRFGDGGMQAQPRVAVDRAGNIVVLAHALRSTISFGGPVLASQGKSDIAIALLNPNGEHIWSAIYGDRDWDVAHALTIDAGGNVLFAGAFREAFTFGDTTHESGTNGSHPTFNALVAKLTR